MEEKDYISNDGKCLRYYEKTADNTAILLVHGSSMSGKIWEKQLQSKELQKYHLISLDLPGHGSSPNSSNPSNDYTLPAYASLLAEFIQQKQLKEYIAVGMSLGGNIIVEALPNLNSVAGLMLVSTAIVGNPAHLAEVFMDSPVVPVIFSEQPEQDKVEQLVKAYFARNTENVPAFYAEDFCKTDKNCRTCLAQSVGLGAFTDELETLKNTATPVALVYGAKDQLNNLAYIENLEIPKWKDQVHLIEDAGHMPQWEAPENFNQLLLNFAESVSLR